MASFFLCAMMMDDLFNAELAKLCDDLLAAAAALLEASAAEQAQLKEASAGMAAMLMAEMDFNNDGKVSNDEFVAAASLFVM